MGKRLIYASVTVSIVIETEDNSTPSHEVLDSVVSEMDYNFSFSDDKTTIADTSIEDSSVDREENTD